MHAMGLAIRTATVSSYEGRGGDVLIEDNTTLKIQCTGEYHLYVLGHLWWRY